MSFPLDSKKVTERLNKMIAGKKQNLSELDFLFYKNMYKLGAGAVIRHLPCLNYQNKPVIH